MSDRYSKPPIADDFPAIAQRMRELRLGTGGSAFALPTGIHILVGSDLRVPIRLPPGVDLVLVLHPSSHPTSMTKIIPYHFEHKDRATYRMDELVGTLGQLYPSVRRVNGEIHLSRQDGHDLIDRLAGR